MKGFFFIFKKKYLIYKNSIIRKKKNMGCSHSQSPRKSSNGFHLLPITTAKFGGFDDQTLICDEELQMKNLSFATDGGKNYLGSVTSSLGAKSAFLIVEFADNMEVIMRVITKVVEKKGDIAKVLAKQLDPDDKVSIQKKYKVLQNNKKWSFLIAEVKKFIRDNPNYDIFENNCYSFVDYILERFAVNYDGIVKMKMPKPPMEMIGGYLKKYQC